MHNRTFPYSLSVTDNLWRRCAGLHQGAEKQVPLKEVLHQTPSARLPARADHPRGRAFGDVSFPSGNIKILLRSTDFYLSMFLV